MRAVDIIIKKRDGRKLSAEEIAFFVQGAVARSIPEYQVSAWLMAAFLKGLDFDELAALTRAMMASGEQYDLSAVPGVKVDKHSTGGVGDKVSLILAPLAACAGVRVPMVSGRSLGHTGGTLDKLESIPGPPGAACGYNPYLTREQFVSQLQNIGCAIIGQSDNFVPADKIFYALRDVTGTVESIPLISASILSKKFAAGADAVVMDVKAGSGAFMETEEKARELADTMCKLAEAMGKKVVCLITDMNQPLGRWVGNAAEARESIEVLKGAGDAALTELCIELGAWMMRLAGVENDLDAAHRILSEKLKNGEALRKFAQMVTAQGGDPAIIENPSLLPLAPHTANYCAPAGGYLASINTRAIGIASMLLGGGRQAVTDTIDPSVSIEIHKRLGDAVNPGDPLLTFYYQDDSKLHAAIQAINQALEISASPCAAPPLIKTVVGG
ncbi:MAG: thymidine phosphorylase [Candidatus Sumerlaeota bacterium]|nr:thymidine phosphorylase [Candidatus Sumerlaeota bacterium]